MSDIVIGRSMVIQEDVFMSRILLSVFGLVLAFSSGLASADQSKDFGDYTIHYSAFTTDVLSQDVARAYNITRSKNRAMLNISVLKKVMETTVQPVKAVIESTATNLSAQLKTIEMRELSEQGAIYYIAELPVAHRETLKFNIAVTPDGEEITYRFSFDQQFFTE
jgi:hypothetical protein